MKKSYQAWEKIKKLADQRQQNDKKQAEKELEEKLSSLPIW